MRKLMYFEELSIDERSDYLWNKGEFIREREFKGYRVMLFALDSEFIELWYHIIDNRIDDIRIEKSSLVLSKYIKDIDISEVIP